METERHVPYVATDILDTPDDGVRYEVIDGELYTTAAPLLAHQWAVSNLAGFVQPFVREQQLGAVFVAPTAVLLDRRTGLEPDIVYLRRDRLSLMGRRGIEGAPDLVVEVLSEGTANYDRGLKLGRYARAGIPHYWIVDVDQRRLEAYRLEAGSFASTGTHGPDGTFESELFPGLSIPLSALWL